jgi:hypothetical protein
MSRLKVYDVFQKGPVKPRRISLIRFGQYVFATIPPNDFVRQTKTQKFYLINEPFGLCLSNQNNPRKSSFKGIPGDYIAADLDGNLTLVTAKDYARKFPKARPSNIVTPLTSDDFLRENNPISVETSTSIDSNSAEVNTPTRY